MAVEHVDITDPEIHEPKGASTATANQVYSANGSGSGTWQKVKNVNLHGVSATPAAGTFPVADGSGGFSFQAAAHGSTRFLDFGTPYAPSLTTSYAKVNPTTTAGGSPTAITEATTAKLTYTGTASVDLDVVIQAVVDQSSGSNKDVYIAIYKNGVIVSGAETVITSTSGAKHQISLHHDISVNTNDYIEAYAKVSSATTVNFYTFQIYASTAGA